MRRMILCCALLKCAIALTTGAQGAVRLESSPNRVRTPLRVDLDRIGTLRPRSTEEIASSNWTVDGCPVDRDFVDFDSYRGYLKPLGIKKIRILSGWAKCEKVKGTVDVAWLDHIVDWCASNRIEVILETSYGNPIYEDGGGAGLADGIPHGEVGLTAWDGWVDFLAQHFRGRVREWAMWNEPDNAPKMKGGSAPLHSPDQVAAFNIRTARLIRRHIPDARIHGLSLAHNDPAYLEECLKAMGEDVRLFDTFIYHGYAKNPDTSYEKVEAMKKIVAKYAPHAILRQGENGCASEYIDHLSLQHYPWTELSQAKWDLRRMLGDLGHDVESSIFGIVDINYAPPTYPYAFCNRKGLLRINENREVIRVKRAYQAVRNLVSVFDGRVVRVKEKPLAATTDRTVSLYEYRTATDTPLLVFWSHGLTTWNYEAQSATLDVNARPGDSFETRPLVIEWKGRPLEDPVWVDLLSGRVYALRPENQIVHSSGVTFADVPVYDSPCLLTERAALDLQDGFFDVATPVWADGRAREMNDSLVFKSVFRSRTGEATSLALTGSTVYRVRLNGKFVGYGPARGPKGMFRVDQLDLTPFVSDGENCLEIEVSGYNCSTFYYPKAPAFLQAELRVDGAVVSATGWGGFTAMETGRIREVSRYSAQRGFGEAYRVGGEVKGVKLARQPKVPLLPRKAGMPKYEWSEMGVCARTKLDYDPKGSWKNVRFVSGAGKSYDGFRIDDLEVNLYAECQRVRTVSCLPLEHSSGCVLTSGEGLMCTNRINDTGFVGIRVKAEKGVRIMVAFDEILTQDKCLNPIRCEVGNAVLWDFDADADVSLESMEPYTFKHAHVLVLAGEAEISKVTFRSFKSADATRGFAATDDEGLVRIHEAARETFAQNAVDVFTDCPSRERAGWLCDSFWTARASQYFTGSLGLEELFLENFVLAERYDVAQGMFPMCYPADHRSGRYIPNWAMWLVLELDDYVKRGGKRGLVERFRPRMMALKNFFDGYRNSDGLLERLPSWVFVEWSHSNALVQDVNYPSNMLWAEALDCLDRLYGVPEFAAEAFRIRSQVRRQSWKGGWFCDNAVRDSNGNLVLSGECTETCQYYAFFTGTATQKAHPDLWRRLVEEFGPDRKEKGLYPEIWPSNAFIGNFLRLELLSRAGRQDQVEREIKGYFLDMAERTGTLWEHDSPKASCCHGFASYVGVLLSHCLNRN